MEPHRIVVVGGGFAGLRTAIELEKRRARIKDCSITLVDRRPCHAYTPLLYEVSSGELTSSDSAAADTLRAGASVRFDTYAGLARRKHVRYVPGDVVGIDHDKRSVRLSDGREIPYDDVVVAVGIETATYGIPGAESFALLLKTMDDALRIRERLAALLAELRSGTRKQVRVVVAGAGPTGVEFSCEAMHYLRRLVTDGELASADEIEWTLLDAAKDVLVASSPCVRARARSRLGELGIRVMTGARIKEVRSNAVVATFEDGTVGTVEADLIVWTAGVRPFAAPKDWGLPTDARGYVRVERSFAVAEWKNAYALGDCAAFEHPRTRERVPSLAQAAVREAGIVAENIARHLERKAPTLWNPPERWVTVVPMGGTYAVADFGRFCVPGAFGYAVGKLADAGYFLSILPVRAAWRLWRYGARAFAKND